MTLPETQHLLTEGSPFEWERPWEQLGRSTDALPPITPQAVASAGRRLDEFGAELNDAEHRLLEQLIDNSMLSTALLELRSRPAEDLFTPEEIELIKLQLASDTGNPGRLRSSLNVVMKATRLCNLRCTYCNYWADGPGQIMTFETMLSTLHGTITDPNVKKIEYIWHGGEPTILGTTFFERALWLQQLFRQPGQVIMNRTQTNAVRLPEEFIHFWKRYDFIVGVSLDGPPEVHDLRRIDKAGQPTAARARAGLDRLRDAGIDPRILLVCDDDVVSLGAKRVLDFLLEIGVKRVGLLNVVPENTPGGPTKQGAYLSWPRYLNFLSDMFDLWYPEHVEAINLREIADLTKALLGDDASLCNFAGDCFGSIYTVEPDGGLKACDRYLNVESKFFGSIVGTPFSLVAEGPEMAQARAENEIATAKTDGCRWNAICNGGCPHDRELSSQFLQGWDDGCCGVGPLLDHMGNHLVSSGATIRLEALRALTGNTTTPEWMTDEVAPLPPRSAGVSVVLGRRAGIKI